VLFRSLAWRVVEKMLEKRIVIGYVGKKILRFLPPLIVTESDVEGVLLSLTLTLEEVMGEVK
jgi:4-aminobutyrate aminotransferase-like enzyme